MRYDAEKEIRQALEAVPAGRLVEVSDPTLDTPLSSEPVQVNLEGKGRVERYPVFPGIEASFGIFLTSELSVQHAPAENVLEVYYCHRGRVGWNMRGGTAIYLGEGDLSVHSMDRCAHSVMMFPLGYSSGISLSVDLNRLHTEGPQLLREAGIQGERLKKRFCAQAPVALPACPALEHIFAPLYMAPHALRHPLLKLKVQELLLYLSCLEPHRKELTQYASWQTERIKEIHQLLTEHLDQRFTIEALSKRYLINASTLKEVFKGVYGLPIATYMKEYRVRQAMQLLRDTDATIADIASQVGYETQGKFTKAFKDVVHMLPTEYRKTHPIKPETDCPSPH